MRRNFLLILMGAVVSAHAQSNSMPVEIVNQIKTLEANEAAFDQTFLGFQVHMWKTQKETSEYLKTHGDFVLGYIGDQIDKANPWEGLRNAFGSMGNAYRETFDKRAEYLQKELRRLETAPKRGEARIVGTADKQRSQELSAALKSTGSTADGAVDELRSSEELRDDLDTIIILTALPPSPDQFQSHFLEELYEVIDKHPTLAPQDGHLIVPETLVQEARWVVSACKEGWYNLHPQQNWRRESQPGPQPSPQAGPAPHAGPTSTQRPKPIEHQHMPDQPMGPPQPPVQPLPPPPVLPPQQPVPPPPVLPPQQPVPPAA